VNISEQENVSQPNAFSEEGRTVETTESTVSVDQERGTMFMLNKGVSLEEIVHMINQVGAAPGDLMAILEALKEAGALSADLEVI